MNRLLTTLCLAASLSAANILAADFVNKDILISAEDAVKLIGDRKSVV